MGDCGSFDEEGRLWLAGRKAQRVETTGGTLFPLPFEARANRHPAVRRAALVGVGPRGAQRPVLVVELLSPPLAPPAQEKVVEELRAIVADVLLHPSLPVDYRHNAKIQRGALALWAEGQLR